MAPTVQMEEHRVPARDQGIELYLRNKHPAGQDQANPPAPVKNEPYKTHLAYVKERRTDEDGEAILDEALAALRARRGTA